MNWRGDNNLGKSFIAFLFLLALTLGELFPVVADGIPSGSPGAKDSIFYRGLTGSTIPVIILYFLLGLLFWYLYKKLHWLVVAIIAAALGAIMEFTFMRPQEATGPDVVKNPGGALLFFVIVWPIIIVVPYAIYQFLAKRGWVKYGMYLLILIAVVLSALTIIYKL